MGKKSTGKSKATSPIPTGAALKPKKGKQANTQPTLKQAMAKLAGEETAENE